jgi:phosphate transport system protein
LGKELRTSFTAELEQLRLQVEVMAVRVDENLARMRSVLATGDEAVAREALAADDLIDDMNVSLTERCYDLLRREAPVASDLRVVVSVVRILSELERVGDLALRIAKLAPSHTLIASHPPTFEILQAMAADVTERFQLAVRAWATMDLDLAATLAAPTGHMDEFYEALASEMLDLSGPDAVAIALPTFAAGRALDRIDDHASIIGARIRYLLTGDPDFLAAEVR